MPRRPSALIILPLLLFAPCAIASTGPTTPTFVLAWGRMGSIPGRFQSPYGVATDGLGNVYVSDQQNHRIQKFDRFGEPILQWGSFGSGSGQFNYPAGVAVDAAGNVYVADNGNHRVQKFSSAGAFLAQWGSYGAGDGQFSSPGGVATDAAGDVYVADTFNQRIQKFTAAGAYLAQWGSGGGGDGEFAYPQGVATDPTGNVYVADTFNHRIQRFTSTGSYLTQWGSFGTGDGQFQYPIGLASDAVGNLYVADQTNHRIQKFASGGAYVTRWGSNGAGSGQFSNPTGVAADAAANLYVVDQSNHRIQKFSGAGAARVEPPPSFLLAWGSTGGGAGQFNSLTSLATDAAGNVYTTDGLNGVQKFSGAGTYLLGWGPYGDGDGMFNVANGVAIGAAGNVYVGDHWNYRVQKFSGTGAYLTQWGTPGAGSGQFQEPIDVATDAAGNVFVLENYNRRIQKFSGTGAYLAQWGSLGSGNGQFTQPAGLATDAAGNVYATDSYLNRVQQFSGTGVYLTQWSVPGSPYGVAADAFGNLYVTDRSNHRVWRFNSRGDALAEWGSYGGAAGQFNVPCAVCTDAPGNVYVADCDNHRVQKFATPPAIALISDIRNDQGRQVRLRILRCSADAAGSGVPILRYDVFRRIDPGSGAWSPPAAHRAASSDLPASGPSAPNEIQLAGWEQVASISAYGEPEYNVVVPTLMDATASSLEYSAFMVRAATADPYTFFDSAVENGFSVDNLPPPTPSPFTAAYAAGATHLHWSASTASDFAGFRLYRGASADFVPGPGNLIATTPDTGLVDAGPAGRYYKLTAVDWSGNEGPAALVGPGQTLDVAAASVTFALEGVRPNPAIGGRLVVRFALPSDEPATLALIDLAGRRVVERAVGSLGPGRHVTDLAAGRRLATGVYLVRLEQGPRARVVKCAVLN